MQKPHPVGRISMAESLNDDKQWNAPLLITGGIRSGSTALTRLLSTHDRICIFNEYSLYTDPVLEDSVWHRIRDMGDDNLPPHAISKDMASLQLRLADELPEPVCKETTRNWLFGLLQNRVQVYGDKMPYVYLARMEELANQFPGVRFLLTLRDGRDVVASQVRQYYSAAAAGVEPERWMRPTIQEAEHLWLRSARIWLSLRSAPPAPCLEIPYEQATRNPENTVRSICDFVGMEYCEEDFAEFLVTYQPVHIDSWRDELPDIENHLSDDFLDALEQLGYR
ncbi:MAG TPA: sulfotransferase [Pirellulales bacterium]|nr:sulfotransferase [Pirellulales bacterium]